MSLHIQFLTPSAPVLFEVLPRFIATSKELLMRNLPTSTADFAFENEKKIHERSSSALCNTIELLRRMLTFHAVILRHYAQRIDSLWTGTHGYTHSPIYVAQDRPHVQALVMLQSVPG